MALVSGIEIVAIWLLNRYVWVRCRVEEGVMLWDEGC